MKKLKTQFLVYFILLALSLSLLVRHSYQQIESDEKHLWQEIAENSFNLLQSSISDFLVAEDARSFNEYRYYYIPTNQMALDYALNVSPLAQLPIDDPHGLVGYFQIDPDGSFHTPYLPPSYQTVHLNDLSDRLMLQAQLERLTVSLQHDMKTSFSKTPLDTNSLNSKTGNVIELGALKTTPLKKVSKPDVTLSSNDDTSASGKMKVTSVPSSSPVQSTKGRRNSVYPNPLKSKSQKTANQDTLPAISGGYTGSSNKDEEGQDDFKQEINANQAQVTTFEEQKLTPQNSPQTKIAEAQNTTLLDQTITTDPFRARLIDGENIIFYRKVWAGQKIYAQGFVVSLKNFYAGLMNASFNSSPLNSFTLASLFWEEQNIISTESREKNTDYTKTLFARNLGYPLNQFQWRLSYATLPHTSGRDLLNMLSVALTVLVTFGLAIIYKTSSSAVILSQKRQDFVSAVSHELKTPLTSIRMYSEMLESNWVEEEEKKQQYYSLISKESERLTRLIDNVLQLARLEKKNYSFQLEDKDPSDDFKFMAQEFAAIAKANGFAWLATADPKLPKIKYDADAVKQILFTLIENSLKFSKITGIKSIEMHLRRDDKNIAWSVSDMGPGVESPELNKIFETFYRVENALTRKTKGTGIGLAMAKMLAEGMGARIEAKNRKDGGFEVRLVFAAAG